MYLSILRLTRVREPPASDFGERHGDDGIIIGLIAEGDIRVVVFP